jgi:intein-encoded DNA endonuclease-like protein
MIELLKKFRDSQEVVQSAMTTLNKVDVSSSNHSLLFFCVDMLKK